MAHYIKETKKESSAYEDQVLSKFDDGAARRTRNQKRAPKQRLRAGKREKSNRTVFADIDYVQDSKLDLISHKSPVLRSYDFKKKLQ